MAATTTAETPLTAEAFRDLLAQALQPVQGQLASLAQDMQGLSARLGVVETLMGQVDTRLGRVETGLAIQSAQAHNSRAGFHDLLQPVPLPDGTLPAAHMIPARLSVLAVGGSELEPGTSDAVSWSRGQSLACIRLYEPNYKSETEDLGSAPERKKNRSSRRRRNYLAKILGVSPAQMAMAAQQAALAEH